MDRSVHPFDDGGIRPAGAAVTPPNDGGPAFPVQEQRSVHGDLIQHPDTGMSMRAYIATHRPAADDMSVVFAEILNGRPMPVGDGMSLADHTMACQRFWAEASAAYSVMQADALIAELAKVQP